MLKDFNAHGDDVKEIAQSKFAKLDRASKMEKMFPFYRMDVNGYSLRIREAREIMAIKNSTAFSKVEEVNLNALQFVFKTHTSWSDMQNLSSAFVSFLKDACPCDDHEEEQDMSEEEGPLLNAEEFHLSVFKLRCLGLLWCDGKPEEKAFEFYDMLQDDNQASIACNDKDFKPNFKTLLDMASEMVYKLEPKYLKTGEPFSQVSKDDIDEVKSTKYDDLLEDFLDIVFDVESKLDRDDWQKTVAEKQEYLFFPKKIREKLGY